MAKQVVISILGGVATTEYASNDVEITIVDFDNDPDADLETIIKQAQEDDK